MEPALFFLWIPGCEACAEAKPKLEAFARKHRKLQVYKVDIAKFGWPDEWALKVEATPTYVLHEPGRRIRTKVGSQTVRDLEKWLGMTG